MSKTHLSVYTNPSEKRSNRNSIQEHNLIFPKNFESILKKVCVRACVCSLHLCPSSCVWEAGWSLHRGGGCSEVSVGAIAPGRPRRLLRQAAGGRQAGWEAPARDTRRARPARVPTSMAPPRSGQPGCRAPAPTLRGPLKHKLPRPGVPS